MGTSISKMAILAVAWSGYASSAIAQEVDRAAALQNVEGACQSVSLRSPKLLAAEKARGITLQSGCECMSSLVVGSMADFELRKMSGNEMTERLLHASSLCLTIYAP